MKLLALLLADPNPLHFDPAAARRLGVADRPVNQGPSNMAMLANLLRTAFPDGRLARLRVQLRGNVVADDKVRAHGRIRSAERSGNEEILHCEVSLEVAGRGTVLTGDADVIRFTGNQLLPRRVSMADSTLTVAGLIGRAARLHPGNDAIVFADTRQTYAELSSSAVRTARSLAALGVGPGDAVCVVLPNSLEFVHTMLATAMLGALFVPVNARLAPRELAYIIPDSGARVLLTTDALAEHADYVARLTQAFPELSGAPAGETPSIMAAPALKHVINLGDRPAAGMLSRKDFLARGDAVTQAEVLARAGEVRPSTPYIMMYTSGTTAQPKGCPLTNESVVRLGAAVGDQVFRITEKDRMWVPLPMFHVAAQALLMAMLNAAGTYVAMTHFEAGAALDLIESERATLMFPAYPTITGPLLHHPEYKPDTFSRVRVLLTVGPPDLLRDYQSRLPHTIHISCYGSTETGGNATMGRVEDPLEARLTSGKPFDGVEVEIRDLLGGKVLPPGETGMIYVRGFNVFLGYHNDPEKTAATMDADGWFQTGDLAFLDERGNLVFQGRAKDTLKVGGENVGCLELETYLLSHPDVVVAAVFGMPDPKYDEVPAAFLEMRGGSDLTQEDMVAYCRTGLARYKVPRYVRFTKEWPMSATKIQKFRLRESLTAELDADKTQ
jgi:fatty-acyl-CoA synthase